MNNYMLIKDKLDLDDISKYVILKKLHNVLHYHFISERRVVTQYMTRLKPFVNSKRKQYVLDNLIFYNFTRVRGEKVNIRKYKRTYARHKKLIKFELKPLEST